MSSLEFDQQSYIQLLAEVAPQVIENEVEYDRLLAVVERLMFSNRTPEETVLFRLLVLLIETYETKNHPIELKPCEPIPQVRKSSPANQADFVNAVDSNDLISQVIWFDTGD